MNENEAKKVCPCLKCETRKPGCHGYCERYREWAQIQKTRNEKIQQAKAREDDARNYAIEGRLKGKRLKQRRGDTRK